MNLGLSRLHYAIAIFQLLHAYNSQQWVCVQSMWRGLINLTLFLFSTGSEMAEGRKDDQQSQWEMLKFDPQLPLNPLSDRHQIWRA